MDVDDIPTRPHLPMPLPPFGNSIPTPIPTLFEYLCPPVRRSPYPLYPSSVCCLLVCNCNAPSESCPCLHLASTITRHELTSHAYHVFQLSAGEASQVTRGGFPSKWTSSLYPVTRAAYARDVLKGAGHGATKWR